MHKWIFLKDTRNITWEVFTKYCMVMVKKMLTMVVQLRCLSYGKESIGGILL